MTGPARGPSFVSMTKSCRAVNILVPLLFSAVVSLLVGNLVHLGTWLLGSDPISTLSLVGSLAGVATCSLSLWFGLRRVFRASAD